MAAGAVTGASGDLERARRRPSFFHGARVAGGVSASNAASSPWRRASRACVLGFRRVLVRIQLGPISMPACGPPCSSHSDSGPRQ
jgi:hypothetical protein